MSLLHRINELGINCLIYFLNEDKKNTETEWDYYFHTFITPSREAESRSFWFFIWSTWRDDTESQWPCGAPNKPQSDSSCWTRCRFDVSWNNIFLNVSLAVNKPGWVGRLQSCVLSTIPSPVTHPFDLSPPGPPLQRHWAGSSPSFECVDRCRPWRARPRRLYKSTPGLSDSRDRVRWTVAVAGRPFATTV